jgi:DNA transposition AAA+ family ATPase
MIPKGTDATAVTAEQIDVVRKDLDSFRRQHEIPLKELAQSLGVGHATVSEFLAGKYKGNNAEFACNAEDWLVSEEQRRSRPATTSFVWTNVAIQIQSVAHYALDQRKIALVYGPDTAGIGKTTALTAIYREIGPRRSALATIDKVNCSTAGMLKKIAGALHIGQSKSNMSLFDRIVEHLKGRSHLLMIDQIHNLRGAAGDRPLYVLADLYDATGSAQLWAGTADMVNYLNKQRKRTDDESLAQIRRRIFPCVDLMEMISSGGEDGKGQPLVTVDQVRQMFRSNRLKITAAAARFLCALISTPDTGGAGFAAQLVEYATALAPPIVTSIDVPQLKSAMRHAISSVRADVVIRDVEEQERRISKTA